MWLQCSHNESLLWFSSGELLMLSRSQRKCLRCISSILVFEAFSLTKKSYASYSLSIWNPALFMFNSLLLVCLCWCIDVSLPPVDAIAHRTDVKSLAWLSRENGQKQITIGGKPKPGRMFTTSLLWQACMRGRCIEMIQSCFLYMLLIEVCSNASYRVVAELQGYFFRPWSFSSPMISKPTWSGRKCLLRFILMYDPPDMCKSFELFAVHELQASPI